MFKMTCRLLADPLLLETPFSRQLGGAVQDLRHVVDAHPVTVATAGTFIDRVLIYCDLQTINGMEYTLTDFCLKTTYIT